MVALHVVTLTAVCACVDAQTNCKSMIEAFAAGGDFHSRTAMGMYQHVADAVKSGEVLLELDDAALAGAGKPGAKKPALLKNVFASERRKAKVVCPSACAPGFGSWEVSTRLCDPLGIADSELFYRVWKDSYGFVKGLGRHSCGSKGHSGQVVR
jgi:hypothetical protein